jgi:hypothetical protein
VHLLATGGGRRDLNRTRDFVSLPIHLEAGTGGEGGIKAGKENRLGVHSLPALRVGGKRRANLYPPKPYGHRRREHAARRSALAGGFPEGVKLREAI